MKILLRYASGCAFVALLAYSRILYIRFFHIHNKESIIGEALNPLNQIAILGLLLFGAATIILLLLAAVGYLACLYDRNHPSTDPDSL